jgi:hypothetical protein
MKPLLRCLVALALPLLVVGCPAEVEHVPRKATTPPPPPPPPVVDENDPRVMKEGEDLYAAQAVERTREADPAGPGLGSGKPDESNGVCRLYAPKLPQPECCATELGFDAPTVQEACGLDVYLGESFQASCGYYFHDEEHADGAWFRMSVIDAPTPKQAIDDHIERLRARQKAQGVEAQKVPGVADAWWTQYDGLAWAFIPGWKKVRQLAWRDRFCSPDAIAKVIAKIAAAKEPAPGERRLDLVPRART